jgi:FkbM family methyltransferase
MRLAARRRLFAVHRWLFKQALRGMGFNNWRSMEDSGELWVIRSLLPTLLKDQKPVVLDIGAHHGEYGNEVLKHFPSAVVHAFEPHPRTFEALRAGADQRISLHPKAMGAAPGRAQLYDRKGQDGSVYASLSEGSIRTLYKDDVIVYDVEVTTLDDFLQSANLARIDFLKVDTEGFEMDVFNGAAGALAEGRLGIIQFEFNSLHVARRQFLDEFVQRLPGHRLYRVLTDGMVALDKLRVVEREIFTYQNILAIPRDIAPARA